MDLFACVTSALEHHAALRAAEKDVFAARAKVDQAVARRRPRVDSQWGYVRVEKDPYFDIAGMGTIVFGEKSNYFGNVSLQVPLYTGGALEAMAEQARHQTAAASENYERQRETIAADAARAYYRALTAYRFIDVMQRQVRAVEEALRVAQAMYGQGIVAKLDVLRPQVALSGAQAMLRKTQNQYQVALEALRHATGLPPGTRVEPVEADAELPLPDDPEEAVKIAWRQRPEVRQLQAYRQAALAGARAAMAQKKPSVGVQFTWDAQRTTLMPMYGDWQAAIVIQQNIFDGDLARSQASEARAQADKLAAKLDELHSGIAVEVRNALATVDAARDQVETRRKAVAAAEEAYRLAMLGYRNEVTPMLDVLQAQAALTEARASLETAKYELNIAIVDAYL
ncbi:MAG: TolC family protein, partial [Armatimonadetes bacterium]|nr:TolC family protein [Armatimonadota bacterium]